MNTTSLGQHNTMVKGEDSNGDDDFVILEESTTLPIRSLPVPLDAATRIELNPLKPTGSFLVSIHPPSKPLEDIKHVPCDIVLVIDVSGSMADLAPLPDVEDEKERESSGLTVLDLVKHACRTIIRTLNEGDRLGLVTFSREANVIQPLTQMTAQAKADLLVHIGTLRDDGPTNLWAGIKTGIAQFEAVKPIGNVQGLHLLTDGQPNYMCPPQGYISKMQPLLRNLFQANGSAPTVQTFGFGYTIQSDLMLSIAKAGNGNYSFIPEVGMIGTVFVHAVANLCATFATGVVLELEDVESRTAHLHHDSGLPTERGKSNSLLIRLGNILYGQSRDLVITESSRMILNGRKIKVRLSLNPHGQKPEVLIQTLQIPSKSRLAQPTLDYHTLRNDFCKFSWTLYPIDRNKEQHTSAPTDTVNAALAQFHNLVQQITSIPNHASDPNLSSLLSDLVGPQLDPEQPQLGQIYQALQTKPQVKNTKVFKSHWQRWGQHYISSQCCAHMRQMCNGFKDAGPLRYGTESELFKKCRDELDAAFDNLPAPVGTYVNRGYGNIVSYSNGNPSSNKRLRPNTPPVPVSMSRYNCSQSSCFSGECSIKMADGHSIKVDHLRIGDRVHNPLLGESVEVAGIIKSAQLAGAGPNNKQQRNRDVCRVPNTQLWITPWHPIFLAESCEWVFPQSIADSFRLLDHSEYLYSVLLAPVSDPALHAVEVEGIPCVTFGHGLTQAGSGDGFDDTRVHSFFGDYDRVRESLGELPVDRQGRWLCGGLLRDSSTDLVCGFLGPEDVEVMDSEQEKEEEKAVVGTVL